MGKNDHKFDESWMFSKIKLIFVIMYNNIMCKYNVVVNSGIERFLRFNFREKVLFLKRRN